MFVWSGSVFAGGGVSSLAMAVTEKALCPEDVVLWGHVFDILAASRTFLFLHPDLSTGSPLFIIKISSITHPRSLQTLASLALVFRRTCFGQTCPLPSGLFWSARKRQNASRTQPKSQAASQALLGMRAALVRRCAGLLLEPAHLAAAPRREGTVAAVVNLRSVCRAAAQAEGF